MKKTEIIQWVKNTTNHQQTSLNEDVVTKDVSSIPLKMKEVRRFHQTFDQYQATPLVALKNLTAFLGVDKIWVKDESKRFGLNAFKVLGGLYAMDRILNEMATDPDEKPKVFVTATDGNHGRGVAWAAKSLGHQAVVFMPQGTVKSRLDNIRKEGAQASILPMGYDDAVRYAAAYAENIGGVLIQDTAWSGYETIPGWITEGYFTIMEEVLEQLMDVGEQGPTHVFLQAGVGSFAAAMTLCLAAHFREDLPKIVILEPHEADCIHASMKSSTGDPVSSQGSLNTIMAGLACGEPNPASWAILKTYAWGSLRCDDQLSALGMRLLGNPLSGDPAIVSGESGAIGAGVLFALMKDESFDAIKGAIELDKKSRVLLINTEGDTDPENYRRVVWEGAYPYLWECKEYRDAQKAEGEKE